MSKKFDLGALFSPQQTNYQTASRYQPPQFRYQPPQSRYQPTQSRYQTPSPRQPLSSSSPPQQKRSSFGIKTKVIGNKFQMSKGQCQKFIGQVKQQLKNQVTQMKSLFNNTHKCIHQRFVANQEKLEKQILKLLHQCFKHNQSQILTQLSRMSTKQPQQYIPIQSHINKIQQQLAHLLTGLKSPQYKKYIAQIVVKDYQKQLQIISQSIINAHGVYERSLGEIEPDPERVECLRGDLMRLFRMSGRNAEIAYGGILNIIGAKGNGNEKGDKFRNTGRDDRSISMTGSRVRSRPLFETDKDQPGIFCLGNRKC